MGQLARIIVDDEVLASVVGTLSTPGRPVGLSRTRLERAKRELALDHAASNL